jgi:hypothetical protein
MSNHLIPTPNLDAAHEHLRNALRAMQEGLIETLAMHAGDPATARLNMDTLYRHIRFVEGATEFCMGPKKVRAFAAMLERSKQDGGPGNVHVGMHDGKVIATGKTLWEAIRAAEEWGDANGVDLEEIGFEQSTVPTGTTENA